MSDSIFELLSKVETAIGFLPCAIDSLDVLRDEMEHSLCLREERTGGMGYYLRLCGAMQLALLELGRIDKELNAVISATYEQRKEG